MATYFLSNGYFSGFAFISLCFLSVNANEYNFLGCRANIFNHWYRHRSFNSNQSSLFSLFTQMNNTSIPTHPTSALKNGKYQVLMHAIRNCVVSHKKGEKKIELGNWNSLQSWTVLQRTEHLSKKMSKKRGRNGRCKNLSQIRASSRAWS